MVTAAAKGELKSTSGPTLKLAKGYATSQW